jgi:hypothetical protein
LLLARKVERELRPCSYHPIGRCRASKDSGTTTGGASQSYYGCCCDDSPFHLFFFSPFVRGLDLGLWLP